MLDKKKCVPCEGGLSPLTARQAEAMLKEAPGWELVRDGKAIRRRFDFKNFKQALALVNQVGEIAESEGHHPDISFGWGYAEFLLWTHAIGGLHENDFIVASKINRLA
ncbi:MAG: 4a-hydroxytetrahydrobiopterin dehydratase [Pseudomonadota bacterium]|nr:4a-hydroxytetrahydrobiopterin dehydratase [Pseudomonadota bacterium]MDE3038245.1 4a-hydroxytetrahydrobiopterin dehydratase [Pseudomonadota bacterium]